MSSIDGKEMGELGQPVSEKIKSDLLTLNMGPQHPATHGVLRVEIKTDSEIVAEAIPHLGYLHRCFEKHAEHLDYRGIIPFTDRMDYLAAMSMEWGYCLAIEKMLGTEVPRRAQYLRVMIAELQRIASHCVYIGTYGIDMGAFTVFLYYFDEREKILRIFEEISGARMLYNYIWLGGVWNDVTDDQLRRIEKFITELTENVKKYHGLFGENKILEERLANVGVISKELAYEYGATGPVLRGSGVEWDLRKKRPYGIYEELDFDVAIGQGLKGQVGDCWDRYHVRVQEIFESIKIIRQCLDGIEEGSIMGKVPKVLKVPEGEIYMRTECPRGELGYHLVSDGGKTPYRLKVKSSCFTHVSMLPDLAPGQMVADLVATIGSIDIVLGEIDR